MRFAFLALVFLALVMVVATTPLGRSRYHAYHVINKPKVKRRLFVWPNSYHDIPRYRYPYYDHSGTGKLVYGFGDSDLYHYSIFNPLEGYFR